MNIEKAIKNLTERKFKVSHFASGEGAAAYLKEHISGTEVGIGGCMSAKQLELDKVLGENNTAYWHWLVPGAETIRKANEAPVYITGANAISEGGEIINIDGTGNRLAAQVYGKKKVYIVAGTNKLCPDLHAAVDRARNVAAVRNCARFDNNNPCKLDGKCHDCRSEKRICNAMLVLWGPMSGMDTEIVLIDGEYGF